MSYCRFSSGDVYLYAHIHGGWCCCCCHLEPEIEFTTLGELVEGGIDVQTWPDVHFEWASEVLAHLQAHRDAGHIVPQYAFDRIQKEIEEHGGDFQNPFLCESPIFEMNIS